VNANAADVGSGSGGAGDYEGIKPVVSGHHSAPVDHSASG
jgi:hypothetical protein